MIMQNSHLDINSVPFDVNSDDQMYYNGTDNPLTHEADNIEYTFYGELMGLIPLPGIGVVLN
jgi:hypothetical protein